MKIGSYLKNRKNLLLQRVKENKWGLAILSVVAVFVYVPFMTGQLNNADGFLTGSIYHKLSYEWEDAQGRFLLKWFDEWRDGMILPSMIVGFCLLLLLAVAVIVWDVLEARSIMERLLIGNIILFSPSVANTITYYYCADSYMLAYFLCILAAALLIKGRRVSTFLGAVVCLTFSMGIYQAYIGATVVLCSIWFIRMVLVNEIEVKELFRKLARCLLGGVAGGGCYLLMIRLLEMVDYLYMTDTRGMDHMLGNMFTQFPKSLQEAYRVFYDYFYTNRIIYNSWRSRHYMNVLLLLLGIIMIIYHFWKKRLWKSAVKVLLLVVMTLLFPVMLTFVVIVAPEASVYAETGMLMLACMNYFYILIVTLAFLCIDMNFFMRGMKYVLVAVTSAVLVLMIVFIGIFGKATQLEQIKIQALAYQMESRIESLEGYSTGMKILVVGRPQWGNYPFVDEKIATITKGMISDYSLTFGANSQISEGWVPLFRYFCGINYQECSEEEQDRIIHSEELTRMGSFPEATSVAKIDGVVVLKLSDIWEVIAGK